MIGGDRGLICLVTDRRRLAGGATGGERLVDLVGAAARAGVDLIQVRERDLEARALADLVTRCVHATAGTVARVVVNDRLDVALAAGAAGVHLRGDAPDVRRVRAMTPAGFLIGRSVHGVSEGVDLDTDGGPDYLLFGTVFPSTSKDRDHRVAGLGELERLVRLVRIPVLAIGGMTVGNAGAVAGTGAAGIAAISLFAACLDTGDHEGELARVVAGVRRAFDTAGTVT